MNRRGFLATFAAALATTAMPAYTTSETGRLIIRNKVIVLKKPLDLDTKFNFLVEHCRFTVSDDFVGWDMVIIRSTGTDGNTLSSGQFINNILDGSNMKKGSAAVHMDSLQFNYGSQN